ncbi:nitroreductase family deazaflavin-dependent oxidoreductase [Nocardia farcinica]|uniref:nitroreductase family deazaflavin-dependent oxidoreductase n=1 Tax=Nocardia farcinica TaxID=37329 RepID=UPI0018953B14|nr:nitroreductase family deazaflavin-dependent oxidoreductase [Nocardia farcinica]MBF6266330.1 nitroreductase family deazaflavin-dependent oxidoreductase [Nocardia farcinica]MCZ9325345.1 nitroreductase family deazaflavin-dependent oxidoreductase [Nocardia farcinica]
MGSSAGRPAGTLLLWRVIGPPTKALAPVSPWWVVLETRGRRSGTLRRVPLARGPREGDVLMLLAVHGRAADWVRNIEADPTVRVKIGWRWRAGRADVHELAEGELARFNGYTRAAARVFATGEAPVVVRIALG